MRQVDSIGDGHTYVGDCAYPHCSNGKLDSVETDVDCGNGMCGGCGVGRHCKTNGDCASGFCNVDSLACVATFCEDGVRDGNEEKIDCGGSCKPCVVRPPPHCTTGMLDCNGDGTVCRTKKQGCP